MAGVEIILALHALATVFMTGLIWFVQVVHYPLFAGVGSDGLGPYCERHQRLTTLVVGPAMLVELATACALVALLEGSEQTLALAGLGLLVVIWLSTALVQVPCHRRLLGGRDEALVRRLVAGNWVRTVCWSVRAGIALALM
ncbi:MAG: hypothetical protein ACF8R7_10820 [Phycisphaerales bacterium JB039]